MIGEEGSVDLLGQSQHETPVEARQASVSDSIQADLRALHAVVEGTAGGTGQEFFQSLVRHLAEAVTVPYAVVAEFPNAPPHVRTLAFWERDRIAENFEYDFTGTPCAEIVRGGLVHYPTGVSKLFPQASPLVQRGIDSYMAVPFLDATGAILGHLAIFDERPMPAEPRRSFIFRIFAARATAERQRMKAEERLRESETRYRASLQRTLPGRADLTFFWRNLMKVHPQRQPPRDRIALVTSTEESHGFSDPPPTRPIPIREKRSQEISRVVILEGISSLRQWELEDGRKRRSPRGCGVDGAGPRAPTDTVQTMPALPGRHHRIDVLAEAERVLLCRSTTSISRRRSTSNHDFEQLIGRSLVLQEVLAKVRRVAPTDASVLITGETGTGKELIARAIHSASNRRDKPLIKVNCAALPAALVESELFGHEKGAFTGAVARRNGRFELANGGTIFLDEIGEVPHDMQAKLLRVLQEHEFDRVGGGSPIKVDIRVLAATNRNLLQAVREKAFREDLYYRLNVFPVVLPPLRERKDDIPLLVQFLIHKFATRLGKRIDRVSARTMQQLADYPWPGNIRELENVLERAIILATGTALDIVPDLLPGAGCSARRSVATHSGRNATRLHCLRSEPNRLGRRWPKRRGPDPGTSPEHAAQSHEEARHHPRLPLNPVAPTTGGDANQIASRGCTSLHYSQPATSLDSVEGSARVQKLSSAPAPGLLCTMSLSELRSGIASRSAVPASGVTSVTPGVGDWISGRDGLLLTAGFPVCAGVGRGSYEVGSFI